MEAPSNATAHAKIMKMRQKIGVQKRVKIAPGGPNHPKFI
jgi:hypothetical protein